MLHLRVSGALRVRVDTVVGLVLRRKKGEVIAAAREETDGRAVKGEEAKAEGEEDGVVIGDQDGDAGEELRFGVVLFVAVELFLLLNEMEVEALNDIDGRR